ncbi:unnamed protein product [Peronospora destructor]|uniref:Kinesin motor domain-containing protein n=1 Tax=Peronospora destructor TaxID=86335 RepID=A0AAV0URZ5_9STRA|nr:unnamed protein product [Peronospora destructor]
MERVHVFVRLQDKASLSSTVGVSRTSTTTVRVEHGEMSPGVANLTFEQVFDVDDSNFHVFQTSLTDPVDSILDGKAVTLIATGTTRSDTSFACHGDQEKSMNKKREPDLITLAIRRIFSNLEVTVTKKERYNVWLSCWGIRRSETSAHNILTNLSGSKTCVITNIGKNIEEIHVEHGVMVSTSTEAEHLYSRALERMKRCRESGLSICSTCGDSIAKRQLLKNEVLSAGFGSFIGQQSLTYLLVTIPTLAQFQQQAVQLLLKQGIKQQDFCREDSVATGAPSYQAFPADGSTAPIFVMPSPPTSPPLSTTSSDSTHEVSFFTYSSQQEKSQTVSPHCSPSTSCGSEDFEKESVVSMRLRRAYELAKAATSSPRKSAASDSISSDEVVSDASADELLKQIPRDAPHRLTLQAHFSRIGAAQFDPECSLVHVIATKDECVDRIIENANKLKNDNHASRLSHNMTCRVAKYEQQLHEALTAQHAARPQLRNSHIKFYDVGREVARLQEEVKALQARQQVLTDNGDAQSSERDQAMLRTLSVRLDETMMQAKDVIKFKDAVIHSLEERFQLASKRGADAVTMLQKERDTFEREKAQLVVQLQQSNEKKKTTRATPKRRVVRLTVELEAALLQWTQEARDREERAEQKCAEQVFQAEQQLRQATAAMQHQMAQFRDELDARMTRQRVATLVACTAGELKKDQLERELQRMELKLAKQKVKMEKKSRVLVATACKQYEQPMARLKRKLDYQSARIDTMLEREQVTLRRARKSEKAVEGWQTETEQLQASVTELVRERNALKDLCKELEQDNKVLKGELERQLLEKEQSVAQQLIAAETRMHEERDVQVENIVKQHNHEISRLRAATREQQERASKFKVVQLVSCEQRSIDALDAEIGSSKEHLHKRVGQRRKAGNSSRSPSALPPAKNAVSLKRALAHKEEEIKKVAPTAQLRKTEENWNLNLALHVTEAATCSS